MHPQVDFDSTYRPYITTILAMSADGKISDTHRTAARFPSPADKCHLEQQLAKADATLFGAGTLRAYDTTALVKDSQLLEKRCHNTQLPQPVHIVCSASGAMEPTAKFFSQPVTRWLLTTAAGASRWQDTHHFERIWIAPTKPMASGFDWVQILRNFRDQGIKHLLVMGGGQLVANLVERDLVDELWLTVCPLIIGGKDAPTPCDGTGVCLANAPRFTLVSNQAIGDEVFLHYKRQRGEF
ncbi:MAG: RibD family protein [Leptolyngbyaceae cyanobacterium]